MRSWIAILILIIGVGAAVLPVSAAILHTTFPFAGTFASPCTGELIAFVGDVDVVIGSSIDPSGEFEITLQSNFRGISGAGIMTATQYQIPADVGSVLSVGLPPLSVTASNDFRVIAASDNFAGNFPLTVTIGANGVVSANVGLPQFVCN